MCARRAHYENSAVGTLRNAAALMLLGWPRTLGMTAVSLLFWAAVFFAPAAFPLLLALGLTLPGYLFAGLYLPLFSRMVTP